MLLSQGFNDGVNTVWDGVEGMREKIKTLYAEEGKSRKLFVAGHSLGGALATIAGARLALLDDMNIAGMYTIGSPRYCSTSTGTCTGLGIAVYGALHYTPHSLDATVCRQAFSTGSASRPPPFRRYRVFLILRGRRLQVSGRLSYRWCCPSPSSLTFVNIVLPPCIL